MKKLCELCKATARIRCESDQASLCWDCDAKVHSANFLVARHSRNLLCRVCQSPTAWSAAGSKLEQTYSDCRNCAGRSGSDGGREENKEKPVKEEVAEIHVLPWSPPPPPESSLSGGEAFHGGEAAVVRKRGRLHNDDRPAIEDLNICTRPSDTTEAASVDSASRAKAEPLRKIRRTDGNEAEPRDSKSPIREALRRCQREEAVSGEEMAECRRMSGGARAIDLNLTLALGLSSR